MSSSEYVIFEINGKKYSIFNSNDNKNQTIYIDYLKDTKMGDKIVFPRVLSRGEEFGKPYLENTSVVGEILGHKKKKKIVVFKYKAKKRTTKKQGCRPRYTEVKIVSIEKE